MISFRAEAEAAASQIVEAIVPMAALRLVGNLRNSKHTFFSRPWPCNLCCSALRITLVSELPSILSRWYPGVLVMLMEKEECDDPPFLPRDKTEAYIASLQDKVQI